MMSKIYKAINAIQAALSKVGVSKDQKNTTQNFKFRGIDDVMNALSPLLAEHGVCIVPTVLSRQVTERVTAKGGLLFYVTLEVKYVFYCAEDESFVCATVYGEAMDSGDKATNKALSAAYKYAVLQTFCIPTEGEDPDANTHEVVAPKAKQEVKPEPKQLVKPEPKQIAGIHLELKNAIDNYKIPKSNIAAWKQQYKVNSLADLRVEDVKAILTTLNDFKEMFESVNLETGEVLT